MKYYTLGLLFFVSTISPSFCSGDTLSLRAFVPEITSFTTKIERNNLIVSLKENFKNHKAGLFVTIEDEQKIVHFSLGSRAVVTPLLSQSTKRITFTQK